MAGRDIAIARVDGSGDTLHAVVDEGYTTYVVRVGFVDTLATVDDMEPRAVSVVELPEIVGTVVEV